MKLKCDNSTANGMHSSCRLWVKIRSRDWWHWQGVVDSSVIWTWLKCLYVYMLKLASYYEHGYCNYEIVTYFTKICELWQTQGSLSYVDTELDKKAKQNSRRSGPGDSILEELVELGSLEAATGHRENQKLTATPGETRQGEISKVYNKWRDHIQRMTHNNLTEDSKHSRCK